MPETEGEKRDTTTITVRRDVYQRLAAKKPYDSMSFNDLVKEMIDQYDSEVELDN